LIEREREPDFTDRDPLIHLIPARRTSLRFIGVKAGFHMHESWFVNAITL
jgi:hypothetical protein